MRLLPPRLGRALPLAALFLAGGILAVSSPRLRADDDFANVGNPTGNAGQFNGNVSTGGSYDPLTANATRAVTDLTVPGAVGAYPLVFTRIANSRYVGGVASFFGDGGQWRHNFQCELLAQGSNMVLTYPDGRNVTFSVLSAGDNRYVDAAVKPLGSLWYGLPGIRDRLDTATAGQQPVLLMADGGRVTFQAAAAGVGHRPALITDPYGKITTLAYWPNADTLQSVTEPGGRWLRVDYLPPYSGAPTVAIVGVTA